MRRRSIVAVLFVLVVTALPAGAAPSAQTRPTLRRGSTGAYVREAQARLNLWINRNPRYGLALLPVNGTFGPATQRTVIVFQRAVGLTADGIIGPRTWAALPALTRAPAPTRRCDPNYTGACVPPYPPDVNCPQIPARDIRVVGSDPHRLDRDNDGIACES